MLIILTNPGFPVHILPPVQINRQTRKIDGSKVLSNWLLKRRGGAVLSHGTMRK
jgi:hypothetical protein